MKILLLVQVCEKHGLTHHCHDINTSPHMWNCLDIALKFVASYTMFCTNMNLSLLIFWKMSFVLLLFCTLYDPLVLK